MSNDHLKMYFLIKEDVDVGHAVNSMGHAGAMISTYWSKEDPLMKEWYATSFRKCTCSVTDKEFEKAKTYGDWFVVTELAFDQAEVILVCKPRREWPKFFQFLKLYKGPKSFKESTIEEQCENMKKYTEKLVEEGRGACRKFLVGVGICDEDGNLTPEYGGKTKN